MGLTSVASDVLIVGAGPTGLVLAIWLARLGVPFRIIDKTDGPARYSRALGVHPRTLEFYRQLGFAQRAVDRGVMVPSVNLWTRRRRRARVPFRNVGEGLTPFPFVLDFAQNEHERLLISELAKFGAAVERRTELLGFEERSDGIRATLRAAGRETVCRCTFLAGCDGAHSTVRDVVGAAFAGGAYEHLFYVADVTARGPAIDDGVHVDLDAADLLAVFDMKGTGHARLVGTIRADAAERRANEPMTFEDVARRPIEQLGLEIDRVNWFSTYHVNHRVASRFRAGRAFLLGDAAHVHSPVGAQGMNTGIGDAVNLGWKLAMATRDGADAGLLDTYELERMAFARTLVTTTDRAFEIATKSGRLAAFVRTTVFPTLVSMVFRSRAARRYLFRTVSQLGIDYRESPLSVGRAGAVRGGDRLPWTGAVEGCDNFTALSSLRWQAHVYGFSVPNDLRYACAEAGLALYQFSWRPSMARSGLERDALYVVRPDGYVAFVDPGRDADRLRSYFTRWGIRGGWPCSPSPDSPRSGMKTSTPPAA